MAVSRVAADSEGGVTVPGKCDGLVAWLLLLLFVVGVCGLATALGDGDAASFDLVLVTCCGVFELALDARLRCS